jgi:hypothetical protein
VQGARTLVPSTEVAGTVDDYDLEQPLNLPRLLGLSQPESCGSRTNSNRRSRTYFGFRMSGKVRDSLRCRLLLVLDPQGSAIRGPHSSSTSNAPFSTACPGETQTARTVPAEEERSSFSIFMASITTRP